MDVGLAGGPKGLPEPTADGWPMLMGLECGGIERGPVDASGEVGVKPADWGGAAKGERAPSGVE